MTTTLPLIGQAVVTDPGTTGASGYTLVAWSPAVSADDRAHFARVPQVSDYLHLENAARVFFSFYRLPGGAWAFSKRFARGTRRGSYNRIVAYTLVLPEEVMEALEWEPRLLPACGFEAAGQEQSFQDLTSWQGEIPRALPDLQVIPPPDCTARRRELLERRFRFLEGRWKRDGLEAVLAQALGVLESGDSLLLPQEENYEQFLGLVCFALPRRDRRAISWTTHLAPGGLDLFRLANTASPNETHASAGFSWSLLRDASRCPGSLALATTLVADEPTWAQVADQWYEMTDASGLSLVHDGAQVKRWIAWVAGGGPPPEGYKSLRELEAYFAGHAIDRSSLGDPWERPVARLALAARTTANLERAGHDARAGKGVYDLLVARGVAAGLLTSQNFAELLDLSIDADSQEAALSLCLRPMHSEPDKARLLGEALDAAWKNRNEALAGRIAANHVVRAMAASPAVAPLLGNHLDSALRALQAKPEGLSEALQTWGGVLYDRAVKELKGWLQEEVPQAARKAADSWDEEVAKERPSIVDLAALLARQGIPGKKWLPFTLAEAAVLDQSGDELSVVRFSANLSFPDDIRQIAAAKLCQRLVRKDLNPGAAHRALVLALAVDLAARPEQAVAVLSRLPEAELRAWGAPIAAVAEAMLQRGHRADASTLGSNWLKQMAMISWGGLPQEAINLVDLLTKADRGTVASVWGPKFPRITPAPEEDAVFVQFRDRLLTDPKLRRQFELSEITGAMRTGSLTFSEGAEKILALVPHHERGDALLDALGASLPRSADKKLEALFELVLSPRLLPSARRLVQEKLFWSALKQTGHDLFWVLPSVKDLTRRGVVLLRVLRRAGELWREDPFICYDRLKEALRLGRLDAVAAFLHGAASARVSFLEVLASEQGDELLLAGLRRAAREAAREVPIAWKLQPFLPHIIGPTPPPEDALR